MSAKLPDGAILSLATTYGAAKIMSAITNADPAVATLEASHGVIAGDFIEITSGWSRINERVFKAGTISVNDVPLVGLITTDTDKFPVGTGAGTIREITAWTQISQILGFETTGGEPGQVTFSYLEEDFERSLPSFSSAQTIKISIADDHTLAGYIAMKAASDDGSLRAMKLTLKDGSVILYNGKIFLNETPSVSKGAVMAVQATFYLQGKPVRY